MTDLNVLFKSRSQGNSVNQKYNSFFVNQISQQPQHYSSLNNNKNVSLQNYSNIPTYQKSFSQNLIFSRSIKTQKQLSKVILSVQDLPEQISYFKRIQRKQCLYKIGFIILSILMIGLFGLLSMRISFELLQLGVSIILANNNFIENRQLNKFFKTLPTLTYLALVYDMISQSLHTIDYQITLANVPSLIISLIMTLNYILIAKTQFLTEQVSLFKMPINTTLQQHLMSYCYNYARRIKKGLSLGKYYLLMNLALVLVHAIWCIVQIDSALFWGVINFGFLSYAVFLFWTVDFFVYSINYIDKQIFFFNMQKKFYQVAAIMSLLRVKSSKQNHKLHKKCLQQIIKQLSTNNSYLQTPVQTNRIINTYGEIFYLYSSKQLDELYSTFSKQSIEILHNTKTINSKKTFKDDLFISLKRFYAKFENDLLILSILQQLSEHKLIFVILARTGKISALTPQILKISTLLQSLLNSSQTSMLSIGLPAVENYLHQLQSLNSQNLSKNSYTNSNRWSER